MAKRKGKGNVRGARPEWGERGDTGDGGLAVLNKEGDVLHVVRPAVSTSVRYFLTRVEQRGDLPTRIALTSALRGEGVTYLARSLGAVLAFDVDQRIVVVELNWWSPSKATKELPGIATVIEGGMPLDEVVIETSNPQLSIIPAGALPVSRRSVVSRSEELLDALNELDKQFDMIVLDLPAVRSTSDAIVLNQLADAYALVVQQGVTPENVVVQAMTDLGKENALGVILNRSRSSVPRRVRRLFGL